LEDLYNNFGINFNYPFVGSIVVGSDFKLGGIVTETDKVAIPIPGTVITEVPLSSLKSFFPQGYRFRSTMGGFFYWESGGRENATFNGTVQCTDCMNIYGFSVNDLNYTQDNRFWIKWIRLNNLIEIYSYGYLKDYNSTTGNGIIKIYLYQTYLSGVFTFSLVDDNYLNQMNITDCFNRTILYNESLMIKMNGVNSYYNASGTMVFPQYLENQ